MAVSLSDHADATFSPPPQPHSAAHASTLAAEAEDPADSGHILPLGLLITPAEGPEETIKRVHDLGSPTCFLSLDAYIGKFTSQLADHFKGLLTK
jgi:hypothetical protein